MAFRLIAADRMILNDVQLFIDEEPKPVSEWPLGSGQIPLQFPPRIKTKSKSSNWELIDVLSWEPVAIYQGSGGTKITLELKYVVTGGKWDVSKISSIEHNIMGYFYRSMATQFEKSAVPMISMVMYKIVPQAGSLICKWRIEDANVTYSDELILDDLSGEVQPQVTTITLSLMMVTQLAGESSSGSGEALGAQQQIDAPSKPLKEWY